jgi:hypothetical protein
MSGEFGLAGRLGGGMCCGDAGTGLIGLAVWSKNSNVLTTGTYDGAFA